MYIVINRMLVFLTLADTSDAVENSIKGKLSVKEAVEELETIESGGQDSRQLDKENLVKPLKKRPKSEGFEIFEKKGIVIGVVSASMLAVM